MLDPKMYRYGPTRSRWPRPVYRSTLVWRCQLFIIHITAKMSIVFSAFNKKNASRHFCARHGYEPWSTVGAQHCCTDRAPLPPDVAIGIHVRRSISREGTGRAARAALPGLAPQGVDPGARLARGLSWRCSLDVQPGRRPSASCCRSSAPSFVVTMSSHSICEPHCLSSPTPGVDSSLARSTRYDSV